MHDFNDYEDDDIVIEDSKPTADPRYQRVEKDSPNRCQANTAKGQCQIIKVQGSDYCILHGHTKAKNAKTRMYMLGQYQARVAELADHVEVKSLREELGILRLLLENNFQQVKNDHDLLLFQPQISDLVMKVEKLVASCHKLEQSTGMMMDKTTVIQMAGLIVDIISHYIEDATTLEAISGEIINAILSTKGVTDAASR